MIFIIDNDEKVYSWPYEQNLLSSKKYIRLNVLHDFELKRQDNGYTH